MDFMNRSQSSRRGLDFQGELTRHPVTLLAAGIAILLSLILVSLSKVIRGNDIKDSNGKRIKELKKETRFARFIQSFDLSSWGKELAGDDPYMIRNGQFRELVLTQPDHLRIFYHKDTKDHSKPRNLNLGEYFGRILGSAVGVQAGERWKIIRKYFDPEFAHQISTKAIPEFSTQIRKWVDELSKDSTRVQSADFGFVADLKAPCRFLPFRLVALQLYGDVFDEKLYSRLLDINSLHERVIADAVLGKRMLSRLLNLLPTAETKRMDSYLVEWERFNLNIIRYAREHKLSCPAERIYRGVDQGGEMTETEFLHTMDEILFANVDISSAVLNALLTNLAAERRFQDALRAEIAEQKGQESFDLVKYIAKQDSLLNYSVMEAMRLTPAFWFSLPECTATTKEIGGYHILAKTPAVIDVCRLNTDAITWGPDGKEFRPERFATMSPTKCRYGFMRFGVGGASGKCLGKNVADTVFKLTVLAVLESYVPSSAKGEEEEAKGGIVFTKV